MAMRWEWRIRKGDFAAASAARRDFAARLRRREVALSSAHDAQLIFGEVVSNAVRRARAIIEVDVLCDARIDLRVSDDGECFDKAGIAPAPLLAEGGRGLYIARALARDFDVSVKDGRCVVSATLP
jgi:anti-sigma regulatory factor (Ser/Thr protein kinase)